jgi:hypothetical protein
MSKVILITFFTSWNLYNDDMILYIDSGTVPKYVNLSVIEHGPNRETNI